MGRKANDEDITKGMQKDIDRLSAGVKTRQMEYIVGNCKFNHSGKKGLAAWTCGNHEFGFSMASASMQRSYCRFMAAAADTSLTVSTPAQIHGGSSGVEFGPSMRPGGISNGFIGKVGPKQIHGSSRVKFGLV
eukprot:g37935.t1